MKKLYADIIWDKLGQLIEEIKDFKRIARMLQTDSILSKPDYSSIVDTRSLLNILVNCEDRAFYSFVKCLHECGQMRLANGLVNVLRFREFTIASPRPLCLHSGLVYIINVDFKAEEWKRYGSDKDIENLQSLFEDYRTVVISHEHLLDCSAEDKIVEFIQTIGYDFYCLVIMSHGEFSGIYLPNDEILPYDTIFAVIEKNRRSTAPLMIVFQACLHYNPSTDEERNKTNCPQNAVVVFPVLPGHSSYRDSRHGSLFIQSFCEAIRANRHRWHLEEMLNEINSYLRDKNEEENIEKGALTCNYVTLLNERLYLLNPKTDE